VRSLIPLAAVVSLLALAGCGGDDETTSPAAISGATGVQGSSSGDFMTAKEFIDAPIPDQVDEVKTIVGITAECEGVNAEPGGDFQVGVAISAAQASPDTPLQEIVADQCSGG
jgi:hypothetical protein